MQTRINRTLVSVNSDHNVRSILLVVIYGVIVAAALIYSSFLIWRGLDPDDVGRLETPFAFSVATQVSDGPRSLYGPFDGRHHLVLVHAPLYYRVAALLAAIITRFGIDPVTAAFGAGRLISLLGTILCMTATAKICQIDGPEPRAGLLAVILIAAAPIPGILSVMVRPDMLAVCLQTWGAWWVLRWVNRVQAAPTVIDIVPGYIAFALAFCTKQHNLVTPAVSSVLLIATAWQRRGWLKPIVLAHLAGVAIAVSYLAFEDYLTEGRMSQCVFVLPGGAFRAINFGGWPHVRDTFAIIVKKIAGYLVLTAVFCALARRVNWRRLDRVLMIYIVAETAAIIPLCYFNLGAADNYALQAVVFCCALLARFLARLPREASIAAGGLIAVAMASTIIMGRDLQFVELAWRSRSENRATLAALLDSTYLSRRESQDIYFFDLPEYNRLYGNRQLIFDEWVFGSFETALAAEPRSMWLRSAIEAGPIHTVIMPTDGQSIPGVGKSLVDIGFRKVGQFGVYRIWARP
jgi:hypothetical protein